MTGQQLEIAGTEAPKNADIEKAIDMWLDAKTEQRRAVETTKMRHATLLLHMQNAKLDAYPFVDPANGKKKQVVIARDPKAKAIKASPRNRRDDDAEIGDEITVEDAEPDNVVEMRRVPRDTVEQEIDPFAATRQAMDAEEAAASAELADDDGAHSALAKKSKGKRGK